MEPNSLPATLTGEIMKILEQLKLPGLSLPALLDARRKDIEALAQANHIALTGAHTLAEKQRAMLQQAVRELQALVLERGGDAAAASTSPHLGDVARKALQDTLGNMRAMAELAAKSQAQAIDVVSERAQRSIEELRALLPHAK